MLTLKCSAHARCGMQEELEELLNKTRPSRERTLGLLFLAGNEGNYATFNKLVNYDREHTHILSEPGHDRPVGGAHGGSSGPSENPNSSSCRVTRSSRRTGRQQQGSTCVQQRGTVQRQRQQEHAQQLEQLLLTYLASGRADFVATLVKEAPALALLGESTTNGCKLHAACPLEMTCSAAVNSKLHAAHITCPHSLT